MDFTEKVVVVTGAASGIGREIALAFARRGANVAVADINEEGLREIERELASLSVKVYGQEVDVAQAGQVRDFRDNVYREMGRVDVLCNNAGVALGGKFEHLSEEDWRWITGINLMGVIYGCHFFYPHMIEQGGGGHIVNIASAAGLFPAPGQIAYSTTKFAVVGLSETLRCEAALHGIGVSVICPGFVLTGIFRSARIKTLPEGETIENGVERAERILGKRRCTAKRVAEKVIKAVEDDRGVVRLCSEAYVMDLLYRFSRSLYGFLARIMGRSRRET